MWLFLIFVTVPIIEIALFIQVGGALGLLPTLAIVVLTAVIGTYLVRSQGLAEIARLQRSFKELSDPTEPLAHGAMILASGLLLLTPGFFTDGVGFALLMPPVRSALLSYLRARVSVQGFQYGQAPQQQRRAEDEIIDITPTESRDVPSGWTRK